MKYKMNAVLIFLGWLVFVYLGTTFINWEANPKFWDGTARLGFLLFGQVTGLMISVMYWLGNKEL